MGLARYIKNQFRHDRNVKKAFQDQYEELMLIRQMLVEQRCLSLNEKTMSSHEMGISKERLCDHEVIVSLTSYGNRIYDVSLVIESIMQGTMKPNRIVLWLAEDEFKNKSLPKALEMQKNRGLQVEFCEDIRSYKKLIPSLKMYPDACIVTIDDDVLYEYDFLERMLEAHRDHPKAVCGTRVHKIKLNEDGRPLSYMGWDWYTTEVGIESPLYFPTGVGGILYPAHCFASEVLNQEAFMTLAPYADDVWFYAMNLMNGTPYMKVFSRKPNGDFIELPSSYSNALFAENTDPDNCRNDIQIKTVFERYGLYDKLKAQSDCKR